jgi:hypothetical protein
MAFVPAPNIVEVQFRQSYAGERTMNRIHVDVLTTPTTTIINGVLSELADWWTGNVQANISNTLALREVYGKSLETQPGPEATFSAGLPASGALFDDPMPNNVSLAVSLRSGSTGRSARGRWFWQGFTTNQITGSVVDSGIGSTIDAAMTALRSAIVDLGYRWVIVSYTEDNAPRPGGPVYFQVNDILLVDNVVDSQRRRLPGRGA